MIAKIAGSRQIFSDLIIRWEVAVLLVSGILLSIDKLNLPGTVSISPAFTLVSLVVLVFTVQVRVKSRLLTALTWFFAYTIVHGLLLSLADITFGDFGADRFLSYTRQMLAILAGGAVFFLVRELVISSSAGKMAFWLLLGGIPALLLAAIQQGADYRIGELFSPINHFVREYIVGTDINMPRVTGISPEPAAFSGYLAAVVIPLSVGLIFSDRRSRSLAGILGFVASVTLILLTFSGVGYFLLIIVAASSLFVIPRKWRWPAVTLVGMLPFAVYIALALTPGNYLIEVIRETESFTYDQRQLSNSQATPISPRVSPKWVRDIGAPLGISDPFLILTAITGKKTGSFASKVYSTVEPLKNLQSVRGFIGYGLGGSPFHMREILSPQALETFPNVQAGKNATLKTLAGKVAAEIGLIGILLLGWVVVAAILDMRKHLYQHSQESTLARAAILIITTLALGSVATFGSLATPYLWLGLGISGGLFAKSSLSEQAEQT